MDFKVVFSPTSIRDLAESVSYIARFDREAATRIGDALIDSAERYLSTQPFAGPLCQENPAEPIDIGFIAITESFTKFQKQKVESMFSDSGSALGANYLQIRRANIAISS